MLEKEALRREDEGSEGLPVTKKQTDILISGGGIPGLALALLTGKGGAAVAVVDPLPLDDESRLTQPETRTSALMNGSIDIIEKTGVWEACTVHGGRMAAVRIVDGASGQDMTFRAEEIGCDRFGVNMPNGALHRALIREAQTCSNIRLLPSRRVVSFEADDFGVSVRTDAGDEIRARLLVGADGRASPTRERAGIGVKERDYGQTAMTCLIGHSRPHSDTSTEFHRPGGPFTMVPLPGNRSSIVWVDFPEAADRFMRMDKTAFVTALQDRTDGMLGEIELAAPPQSWPLKALRAERMTGKRVTLIAEAAHVLHPLGAQGLNLSLRDAGRLADALGEALRCGIDPGSSAVLAGYGRASAADARDRLFVTGALNRIVSGVSPLVPPLRRAGMKAVGGIRPLRDAVMRYGVAGQAGGRG